MKRTVSTLMLAAMTLVISSCGGGPQKPDEVAKAFLKAVNNEDFATAKEYSTKETKQMLDMMKGMMEKMGDKKKSKKGKLEELKNTEVDGDKAVVTYCCDKEGKDAKVHLKKVDGNWKVHLNKGKGKGKSGGGDSGMKAPSSGSGDK